MRCVPMENINRSVAMKSLSKACVLLAVLVVLLASGCRTVPVAVDIPQFRQGVATADQMTSQAFAEINAFDRQLMIDMAVKKNKLNEEDFHLVLERDATEKWKRAFGLMDSYAGLLQELLDPKQREGVQTKLVGLGTTIGQVRGSALPDGVTAGFAALGGLLVQIKADADAMSALETADPGVASTFEAMVSAIGQKNDEGIRGQNRVQWGGVLKEHVVSFNMTKDAVRKRAIAAQYVRDLDARDASDQSLSSIVRLLTLLKVSHEQLTKGRKQDARSLLDMVGSEYARWDEIKGDIEKAQAAAEKEGGK